MGRGWGIVYRLDADLSLVTEVENKRRQRAMLS